jgi:hypothetical protein
LKNVRPASTRPQSRGILRTWGTIFVLRANPRHYKQHITLDEARLLPLLSNVRSQWTATPLKKVPTCKRPPSLRHVAASGRGSQHFFALHYLKHVAAFGRGTKYFFAARSLNLVAAFGLGTQTFLQCVPSITWKPH